MAYLAVNRDGEELVFNDCPICDRVEDTWKIPMLRWELVYDDPDDHSAGVHEDEVRDDDYGVTLPNGTIERIIGGLLTFAHNELGLTIERLIEIMVDNKLSDKDFNIIPRTVEKTSKDKMLNDIEIVMINKNLNDRGYEG